MSINTQSLAEIHAKATARVSQLRADIEEAQKLLSSYEQELTPLLQIMKVTAPLSPEPTEEPPTPSPAAQMREAVEEVLATEGPAPSGESVETVIPSRRYSQYKLAPRFRRFLDRFGNNEKVERREIAAWYRRALSPGMADNSLCAMVSEITRTLVAKGILAREGEGVWRIVR
jgi:hypothetical protein